MSRLADETIKQPEGIEPDRKTPAGLFEHYCEHPGCTKWGGWGFPSRQPGETIWFCGEHRIDGDR